VKDRSGLVTNEYLRFCNDGVVLQARGILGFDANSQTLDTMRELA